MNRALARGGLALLCAGLAAGCGGPRAVARPSSPGTVPLTTSLVTSLVTAQGTWAITVMGGTTEQSEAGTAQSEAGTAADNAFWQLFVRPAGASRWSLVTPQGVADNGGLVAAGGATSLTVGVRPSQNLTFSPLATSTDAGKNWTPGLLDAGLADTPGAIAVDPSGRTLALLRNGTIQEMTGDGWASLTTLKALAASAPGRECGLVSVEAISFGPNKTPMAAGSCVRPGVAGVFIDTGGTWRSAGLVLPAGFGQVRVLGLNGNVALLAAGNKLLAGWGDGTRWTVSAPVTTGSLRASGFGRGGSVWLLSGGGRAETISGPGAAWQALPPVPAGTQVLVPGGGALAVSGAELTVWQLAGAVWAKVQLIHVPIEYGSSG